MRCSPLNSLVLNRKALQKQSTTEIGISIIHAVEQNQESLRISFDKGQQTFSSSKRREAATYDSTQKKIQRVLLNPK
jgi:hypothetical protein